MKSITAFLLLFTLGITFAQVPYKKDELRKKSRALSAEIAKLNKNLNATKSNSTKSLLYIKNLEKKIDAQNELVSIASRERKVLEDEIYLSQLEINKYKRELGELKKEYKDVLINAYKNKSLQNKVLFILSSKSFTEAYRRIKYLEKYSGFQGEKADEIKAKQRAIEITIAKRKAAMNEKEQVLAKQQILRENLEIQRKEQNQILAEYKNNEGKIAAEIQAKQVESRKLESQIEKIIQEEIRIAKEKAEAERKRREEARKERERLAKLEAERKAREAEEARKRAEANKNTDIAAKPPVKEPEPVAKPEPKEEPKPEKTYSATTESSNLGASFAASRGRLPWPVSRGEVVGRFGRQPHPVLKNIYENHAGVMIGTSSGSTARAVYAGTVQAIMTISGGNKAVMISHGDHFTVYNNLSSVFVSKGDKVSAKQDLGRIYTDSDGNTILDFQVWKGTSKQDPAGWISGM